MRRIRKMIPNLQMFVMRQKRSLPEDVRSGLEGEAYRWGFASERGYATANALTKTDTNGRVKYKNGPSRIIFTMPQGVPITASGSTLYREIPE